MKITFRSEWVDDCEREGGWVFVDTRVPDPFFKSGHGGHVDVLTRTKRFRKRPDVKAFQAAVRDLKAISVRDLKAISVRALKAAVSELKLK